MNKILKMIRLNKLEEFMVFLSALAVLILFVMTVVDVIGRYFFRRPLSDTYIISAMLLAVHVYLAISYTQRKNEHITVDMFTDLLSHRAKLKLNLVWLIIQALTVAFIAYAGYKGASLSLKTGEMIVGIFRFPIAPVKMFVPFGSFVLLLRISIQIVTSILELISKEIEPPQAVYNSRTDS